MKDVVKYVNENMCEPHGHELLYLCKFGSHLYGTHSPESDLDYKGIFLPSKESLLLGHKVKSLHYSSGKDNSRNSNEDIDIDLWSLQYFLELISKGETNAIDVLYSITNKNCLVHYDTGLNDLFYNPLKLFDPVNCNAFVGYAIGQAKKYGIKGSRLGVIKQVYEYLEHIRVDDVFYGKLSDYVEEILDKFYDPSFCFMKEINEEEVLVLCGKVHLFSISLDEFYNRVKREYEKYGDRTKKAEQNEGVDWKAISHAVRCLVQMEELLTEGKISYPLKDAQYLLDIKQGKYDFCWVEELIKNRLEYVDSLQSTTNVKGYVDRELIEDVILDLYGEE